MNMTYMRLLLFFGVTFIMACESSLVTDVELLNPENPDTTLQQRVIGKWTGNGELCGNVLYNNFDQNYKFREGYGIAYNSLFQDSILDSTWFDYTIVNDSLYITWDLDTIQYLAQYGIDITGGQLTLSTDSVFCPADSTYQKLQSIFAKW